METASFLNDADQVMTLAPKHAMVGPEIELVFTVFLKLLAIILAVIDQPVIITRAIEHDAGHGGVWPELS
jgi:hypothetical protein